MPASHRDTRENHTCQLFYSLFGCQVGGLPGPSPLQSLADPSPAWGSQMWGFSQGTQELGEPGRSCKGWALHGGQKTQPPSQFFLQRHLGQNRHLRCWGSHGTMPGTPGAGGMPMLLPNLQMGAPTAPGTLQPRAWAARGPGPEQRSPGFQETECVGAEATRLRPRPREKRGGPWPCSGEPGPPPRGRVCLSLSRPVRLLRAPV